MSTINLTGVPETMLWPLYNRAHEQKRKDRLIYDPLSLQVLNSIDYDYKGNFGKPSSGHPLRARLFDDALKTWLKENPDGVVVSLGEGLDTQFWRVDNGLLQWFSVDVPEAISVRNEYLPAEKRVKNIPCSALDMAWMEQIPRGEPVFILLAGVIMYFTEDESQELLKTIVERFPESEIIFDMIPEWYSAKTMKGMYVTKKYKAPPMPWGVDLADWNRLLNIHPALKLKRKMSFIDPYPKRMRPFSYFRHFKGIKEKMSPWMIHFYIDLEPLKN